MAARTEPAVSVVIPTLDRRWLLERAVRSVLGQNDDRMLECIVVDDGSTDGTVEWLHEHAEDRVMLLQTTGRTGAAAARNVGLDHARGRYVAFCDSDDEWLPHHLSCALDALDGRTGAAVCGMLITRSGRTTPADVDLGVDAFEALLRFAEPVTTSGIAFDRAVVGDSVRFDERFPAMQDRQLLLALAQVAPVVSIRTPTYRWHWHEGQRITDAGRHVAARRLLLEVHTEALAARPDANRLHWRRLARAQRRIGDRRGAAASLGMAAQLASGASRLRLETLRLATRAGRIPSAAAWRTIGV